MTVLRSPRQEAVRLVREIDHHAAQHVTDRLHAHNATINPAFARTLHDPRDPQPLHLFARNERGEPVAGLVGRIYRHYGWLQVDILWVEEEYRERDLGSCLLRSAEDEARRHGCTRARLFTRSFQAPDFYIKHGYELYGRLDEFPPGASEHYFQKRL